MTLSNTSVQFSVAVLSRLSRIGIDAFTLQVGRAICYNFSLEPNAQERISDAVLRTKRYGSYGDLIWFGFGIKEVVADLADTEEVLTLVGLCAALSTPVTRSLQPRFYENFACAVKRLNSSHLPSDNGKRSSSYALAYWHPLVLSISPTVSAS